MKSLVFKLGPELLLKIDDRALEQLLCHAQHDRRAPEAGGVLLGRWIADDTRFIVDDISEPTHEDRRTRTSFFRSAAAHARAIEASLSRSKGTCGYLGEWHTHPEPLPIPSSVDLHDWRRRLRRDRLDIPRVFFVIVGTTSVTAWTGDRRNQRLEPLQLRPDP